MPIYAYKCDSCGFAKDVLQKISDQPLTQCPSCEAATFRKQLTAAGFQLKGSGWYVTDFKGGGSNAPAAGDSKSTGSTPSTTESAKSTSSDSPAPAAAAAPAPKKAEPTSGSGS